MPVILQTRGLEVDYLLTKEGGAWYGLHSAKATDMLSVFTR